MNEKPTMMTYIKESPDQIRKNVDHSTQLTQTLVDLYVRGNYKNVVIIASGSSNNGSQAAKAFVMKYLKCNVEIVSPSAFNYGTYIPMDTDFCLVISQSGHSTNSLEALRKLKAGGRPPIGLTAN
jgi:glucoselysine-6-phosphate deglycase